MIGDDIKLDILWRQITKDLANKTEQDFSLEAAKALDFLLQYGFSSPQIHQGEWPYYVDIFWLHHHVAVNITIDYWENYLRCSTVPLIDGNLPEKSSLHRQPVRYELDEAPDKDMSMRQKRKLTAKKRKNKTPGERLRTDLADQIELLKQALPRILKKHEGVEIAPIV